MVDCVMVPPASGIDMVMSIVMPVVVNAPFTLPSIFCGLVHAILYENWPPLSFMSRTLQSLSLGVEL